MKCPNCNSDEIINVKVERRVVGNISHKLEVFTCLSCGMLFSYSSQEIIEQKRKPKAWR